MRHESKTLLLGQVYFWVRFRYDFGRCNVACTHFLETRPSSVPSNKKFLLKMFGLCRQLTTADVGRIRRRIWARFGPYR